MWLVLCSAKDLSALWAARGLAARGLRPLEIVTAESLTYNVRFEHRLSARQATVKIALADGRVIDSATVHGTLNRLQVIPFEHLRTANEKDRQYAEQELLALYFSWLYCMPGAMVNRPTPQALAGDWRHLSEWVLLASKAGLITKTYHQSDWQAEPSLDALARATERTLIVVDDICCGPTAPSSIIAGCVRLRQLSETSLLGVDFQLTPTGDWIFINATLLPDLCLGGTKLLDAVAKGLRA
jgi:hypothetical protein